MAIATISDEITKYNYTTEEVAHAVGRKVEQWSRIRQRYIANYDLKVIRVGRRLYYSKETVDKMIDELVHNGE